MDGWGSLLCILKRIKFIFFGLVCGVNGKYIYFIFTNLLVYSFVAPEKSHSCDNTLLCSNIWRLWCIFIFFVGWSNDRFMEFVLCLQPKRITPPKMFVFGKMLES